MSRRNESKTGQSAPRVARLSRTVSLAAVAVLATTSLACAADQLCEGWLKFGRDSHGDMVYVLKPDSNPNKCWFDSRTRFGKAILDHCFGEAGGIGAQSWCRITGTLRPSRLGLQVVRVTRVALTPDPNGEGNSDTSDRSTDGKPDDKRGDNSNQSPEKACHSQAMAALGKWPVTKGQFEIIAKGKRCLLFLQANSSLYPGKRTAWLIEGKDGELLAEFYAPTDGDAWKETDRGLCSFRGGRFPTSECQWWEWMEKADQM